MRKTIRIIAALFAFSSVPAPAFAKAKHPAKHSAAKPEAAAPKPAPPVDKPDRQDSPIHVRTLEYRPDANEQVRLLKPIAP